MTRETGKRGDSEYVVRKKGTGSYDHSVGAWKLRSKSFNCQASTKQLGEYFGLDVPRSEDGSRPYWSRYLEDQRAKVTPYQARIASLRFIIEKRKEANLPTAELENELAYYGSLPAHDIDHSDTPAHCSDTRVAAAMMSDADATVTVTDRYTVPDDPPKSSLRLEIDMFVARKRERSIRTGYKYAQALGYLLDICGDIDVTAINKDHFRSLHQLLVERYPTSLDSQRTYQRCVVAFLKHVEIDYDVTFRWRNNPDYRIKRSEGSKEQYDAHQLETAIRESTGDARAALMLALNFGWYWADMQDASPAHIVNGKVCKCRAKKKHLDVQVIPHHQIWDETREHLVFPMPVGKMRYHFAKFAKMHNLPTHDALRRTAAQWIQDNVGEEAARLYRGEPVGGVHGSNYIRHYSPTAVEKLSEALGSLRSHLFGKR